VHDARAGNTQRLAGEALEARTQRQVLALDLLHRQLPYRVLRGRKMTCVNTCLVRVITGDPKGGEQGAELQEHRILTSTEDIRKYSPRLMIRT